MSVQLKLKLRPAALQPKTTNGYITDMQNIAALVLQNVGTTNVRIFNGAYTILANGGSLTLNVTEDFGSMDVLQLDVVFQGAGTNRLEVLTMRYGPDDTVIQCPS